MNKNSKLKLFALGIILTYIVQHILILLFPNYFLIIGGYHIKHLTVGAFLLLILSFLFITGKFNKLTVFAAGISVSLITDEILFLALTDGSRAAYFTPLAWISSAVLHIIVLLNVLMLTRKKL